MKKTNKANFKKIVGGVLAAVMAAAMVATADRKSVVRERV